MRRKSLIDPPTRWERIKYSLDDWGPILTILILAALFTYIENVT